MGKVSVSKYVPGTVYQYENVSLTDIGWKASFTLNSQYSSFSQVMHSYANNDLLNLYYVLEAYLKDKNLI